MKDPATIKAGIHAWVVAGTGLATGKVIWAEQGGPRPVAPYIAMRLTNIRGRGRDWLEAEEEDDLVTYYVRGVRHAVLQLQAFALATSGVGYAANLLDDLRTRTELPSLREALSTAHVGVLGFGAVSSVDGIMNMAAFEPRALLDVRLALRAEVSEAPTPAEGGLIESAEVNGVLPVGDDDTDVTEIVSFAVPRDPEFP